MEIRPLAKDDLPFIHKVLQRAFRGFPWFEELSDEEVQSRLTRQIERPGFRALIATESETIIGVHWWDTPSIDDLGKRNPNLAEFVIARLAPKSMLIWERGLFVDPDQQGKGIGTQLKTAFLLRIRELFESSLILTRMREDNVPSIKISRRLAFSPTGIKEPDPHVSDIFHEFWYLLVD